MDATKRFMQWYIRESELKKKLNENYEFPKKYHSYKYAVGDFISEVRQLDEFLYKDAEKKLPRPPPSKKNSRKEENFSNEDKASLILQKIKVGRINTGIPAYTLVPDDPLSLKKLLIRASLVKKKDLLEVTRKYLDYDRKKIENYEAKVLNHVCSAEAVPQLLLTIPANEVST